MPSTPTPTRKKPRARPATGRGRQILRIFQIDSKYTAAVRLCKIIKAGSQKFLLLHASRG
jgi:hypothetical protein